MIRCDACRTLNDDNARACTGCGTSLWLTGRAPTGDIHGTRGTTTEPRPQPQQQQQRPANTPPPAYAPPMAQPTPGRAQPTRQSGYRCPYCHSPAPPFSVQKISEGGWIVFALMLFFCFPLFWIGLLMKEDQRFCSNCRARLG